MTDAKQAAETLALSVWDLLADYHHEPQSVTDEAREALRTTAFEFSRNVQPSDVWQLPYARGLATAAIMWANDDSPENFRALERASRHYESLRISPPTK
jgi:hypothetical protein